MARNPNKKRCKAKSKQTGKSCKNWAKPGYDVCHYHGAGGGAPPESMKENKNAVKHGLFAKYLPKETLELVEQMEGVSPLDILWMNIKIQFAAIMRAQRIMWVENQNEMIKEQKKQKFEVKNVGDRNNKNYKPIPIEEEYEFQFAWDRHATFLNAQSRAMATLQSMLKRYEEMVQAGLATEEQRLRIEKLKAEIEAIKQTKSDQSAEEWVEALKQVAARRNIGGDAS